MDQYFAMGRGLQDAEKKVDVPAMEMKKWFDTNCKFTFDQVEICLNILTPRCRPLHCP